MEIKINAVGFSASSQLEDFIQKKISKLDKYHDGIIGSEVTLKLEKDDNLENKVVEVLLNVKGQEVFAKKNAKKFEELYGAGAVLFASPGRINLIGEHTDYNGGFVFPGAVDKGIVAAIRLNGTDRVRAYAFDLGESSV